MKTKRILKPVGILVSLVAGLAVVAAPRVELEHPKATGGKLVGANVHYREARADKPPPPGDDGNVANIKKLCSMLGVSDQFHGAAPAKCGLKKVGREPEAVLCATPPPKNTSQTEDSNNRKCEYCVAVEPEVKCDEELKVKAKVETAFELPLPYKLGTLSCDAGAEYEAEAKAKIEVQNTKWNSFADGSGTDEAVKYISSITKSSALSAAKINLAGSCKLDGRLIDAAMSAKINLECEIKSTATLGATADRDKKTCGDDPCATKAEPQTSDVMAKAIAHPCPDTETTTANEPEDAGTPETSTVLVTDQVHAF